MLEHKSQPIGKGSTFQQARWSYNLWPRTNTLGQQLSQFSSLHVNTTELAAVEKGTFPKPEGDCVLMRSAGKEKKKKVEIWNSMRIGNLQEEAGH